MSHLLPIYMIYQGIPGVVTGSGSAKTLPEFSQFVNIYLRIFDKYCLATYDFLGVTSPITSQ